MTQADRPTLLLVGAGERMQAALEAALERHQLMVESTTADQVVEVAFAGAPDLLLLLGDAAQDGGREVLGRLSANPVTAMVPVVLLSDEAGLEERLKAFRHGVVAVVPRTASADGMARKIAELARELPERPGETSGDLEGATIDELVKLFSEQLRSGILAVSAGDDAAAQVVLSAGRPVTEAIHELVERLRPMLKTQQGPLRYEFHEAPAGRLGLLDEGEEGDVASLAGHRLLVIERNPARADALVQELRAGGALVVVADGEGEGLDRARAQDPEVVLLDASGVDGWALPALRKLRRDGRLRWSSLLVLDSADLWPEGAGGPDLGRLAAAVAPLVRADSELADRAKAPASFDTRLELVGPSRTLRALVGTGLGLRASIVHPRVRVDVDLAEGLVAGATAKTPTGKPLAEGPAAIAALLGLSSGRVHVERKDAPATANVMAPLDDALAAAAREVPPVQPSLPPPAMSERPARDPTPTGGVGRDKLIGRLEELLERLQTVLPAAEAAAAGLPAPANPPKAEAIPPPARLPPAKKSLSVPKPTLAMGSVPRPAPHAPAHPAPEHRAPGQAPAPEPTRPPSVAPPWIEPITDELDDLPELEATAEPTALAQPIAPPPPPPPAPPQPEVDVWADMAPAPVPIEEPLEAPAPKRGRWIFVVLALLLIAGGLGGAGYWYWQTKLSRPVAGGGSARLPGDDDGERGPPELGTPDAGRAEPADAGPGAVVTLPDAGPAPAEDAGSEGADSGQAAPIDAGAVAEEGEADAGAPAEEEQTEGEIEEEEVGPREEGAGARVTTSTLIRQANFARNAGNLAQAEEIYQRILRRDRRNARALAGMTRLKQAQGNAQGALSWALRLVEAHPTLPANRVLLGDCYLAVGNRAAAERSWQRALDIEPGNRAARQRLGR